MNISNKSPNVVIRLRGTLGAVLVAAVAATTLLPAAATAQSAPDTAPDLEHAEFAGNEGETAIRAGWICGYVKRKKGRYSKSDIKMKRFKERVTCHEKYPNTDYVVVRGYDGATKKSEVIKDMLYRLKRI